MRHRILAIVILALLPAGALATTADDLSSRIVVDGYAVEYQDDEWVLAPGGPATERAGDSVWGGDNDIGHIAVTWDSRYLYVFVECVARDSRLFLLLDHAPGGVADMRASGPLRRGITFSGSPAPFRPDLLIEAIPQSVDPSVWRLAPVSETVGDGVVGARFVQTGYATPRDGALEVAIPWSEFPPAAGRIAIVAAVTGDIGSGCGDAAPDPHGSLSSIRADDAYLDRPLVIVVDDDGDGVPDAGTSPRERAAVEPPVTGAVDGVNIELARRSFAPDEGERATFRIAASKAVAGELFVSARVFSRDGELVSVLFTDEPRSLVAPPDDVWNGTNRSGDIVPGGIYIINVSWGGARGSREGSTSAAVAVVR